MSFPWLQVTRPRPGDGDRRVAMAVAEVVSRAGTLFRLGFSADAATERLIARVAWEHDEPHGHGHHRPHALSNQAIGKLVADTYARRPG